MSKKRSYRRKIKKRKTGSGSAPPDRRAMDKMMADLTRHIEEQEFDSIDEINAYLQDMMESGQPIPETAPRTPLEKAQGLMYKAWEAKRKRRRISLAKEALAISEDCADAYVLLAEESARTPEKACEFYAEGVAAGERALGEETFTEGKGHFWGILETRPYMRARAGLASCLWDLGRRDEAIEHYQEMLELNPGDNQGIRYTLLTGLLEEGRDAETKDLLDEYEGDITAAWLYNRALFLYRQGKAREARMGLLEAVDHNPHVLDFLLGYRDIPRRLPPYMGLGDPSEAAYYVTDSGHLWQQEEGALDWLEEVVD